MKIGLICPYNIFKGGGVQECVLALQAELSKRGHTVKVLTPQPRSYEGEQPENVIFLGASRDMKSLHTTVQVSASGNTDLIAEVLEAEQFDVLNFHEPWIPILSRQILAKSSAVNVATFHARLPDTRMSKTIEKVITPYTRSILKSLHHLTAVSDSAAQYVSQLTDAEVTIVPNGIDLDKYQPKPSSKTKTPTIFYIGRLEKRKGLKYLLKAFAVLQETLPEAQLIIGGDGPDREKLEELAQVLDLKNVQFLGFVDDAVKIKLLQSSTVMCSPALYGESFGIVLLEAMASGTPVVAGNNPGYIDVLQGRGEISIVDPKHTADFARRLHVLLTDEGLRDSWNAWAHDYVQQFDYHTVVDQYEAVYKAAYKQKAAGHGSDHA